MKTIAFVMQKGGAGKSTFCDQLAFFLTSKGCEVEVGDLDDQQSTKFHERHEVPDNPDYVLLDTRGALDVGIEINGKYADIEEIIRAVDLVVIPTLLEGDCLEPLRKIVTRCEDAGKDYIIVTNQVDMRLAVAQDIDARIRDEFPKRVSVHRISRSTVVSKARVCGLSFEEVSPKSRVTSDFEKLATEIMELVA